VTDGEEDVTWKRVRERRGIMNHAMKDEQEEREKTP
jgi:hypothetical protein